MLMTIELSSLKIRKTSCCKPEKLNNRMIALYVSGTLKHSMHMTVIKYSKHLMFDHVFVLNDDKYYCLFFMYKKQT